MYKFAHRLVYGVLALIFLNSFVFAIESEYKNALMKVELIKTSDGAYSVDLYTKNSFTQPVKVIKKSDLNYYILLPETKNESSGASANGTEIRSVSTNVYPYAGQDVNNGYVKININTTKPINFRVNVKNPSAATSITPKTAQAVLDNEEKKEIQEPKLKPQIQKKNLESSISEKAQLVKKVVREKLPAKFIQKEPQQKPSYQPVKIEDVIQQEVQKAKEEKLQEIDEELASIDEKQALEELEAQGALSDEDLNQIERIAGENSHTKSGFFSKPVLFGIRLSDILLLFLIFVSGLFFMMAFLKRKNNIQTRLKSKAELMQSSCTPNFKKENEETKNDGQYFVFDKNIKQTGFCDPATSAVKRNYELSTYEPELKNKYNRNAQFKKNESEYDIIQKILKEDTFIDIPNATFAQQVKVDELDKKEEIKEDTKKETVVHQAPKAEIKKEANIQAQAEPSVISSVEIAPKRGFMLVSYNDNISLMGYIFDDVFALYNFKVPKLENYDIKYRLSEKDDKIARFIVKIANTKMLIAVDKSSMVLEVLL